MDTLEKYFFTPKSFTEMKDQAMIVIDTNVLLSAYQWKEITLKEVLQSFRKINRKKKLKIPSHVVKEFMDQRPKRIIEMIEKIDKLIFSKLQKPAQLSTVVPALQGISGFETFTTVEKQYFELYDSYRKKLMELKQKLKDFLVLYKWHKRSLETNV